MKKINRKLSLNKQTVASLDHLRMGLVAGGQAQPATHAVEITYTNIMGCPNYSAACNNLSESTSCLFCVPTKADSCLFCAIEDPIRKAIDR